jgi:hypothetical protein
MSQYDGASILMGLQFGFETVLAVQLAISFYFPIRPFPLLLGFPLNLFAYCSFESCISPPYLEPQ